MEGGTIRGIEALVSDARAKIVLTKGNLAEIATQLQTVLTEVNKLPDKGGKTLLDALVGATDALTEATDNLAELEDR